ncbi:hypothetical protein AUJ10_00625 [Candidatus Pacearchaeota archaeon CG1_02_31_27]|nr:MAG: hypothetical protein AUJ10_00625 [Candidatus Pacearchaeota archaeon CG1_02_31_27]PIN92321.1 MAG: hypothetical protein COU55_00725 [Candidatus Pacearchaeota archaeon CG10_big_fil_rev_8_21_14_0_10_31_59]PIZ79989.1 MAG: hypothetical protein COX99_03365 [Candidatus Pacearchaeota archaeon CG_4_10_14_0_2_um_filter_31_10]
MAKNNKEKDKTKKLSDNELMTAILSYIGILVLIPLLVIKVKDRNDFIRFHLSQGLTLFIIEVAIAVVQRILAAIPFIGWILASLISLLWVIILIIVIIAIIKAVQNEKWEIPVVNSFSKHFRLK